MALTREIIITYGSFVISTATARNLHGKVVVSRGFEEATAEFTFEVSKTTDALFAAECVAAEAAFQKPYQDLTITQGGETWVDAKPSTGTALDTLPQIDKPGTTPGDSARSRFYTASVTYGLAADTGAEAQEGLRDLSVDVAYDPARRRSITISGTFTAVDTTGARAQYRSKIDAIETTVFGAGEINITAANRELVEEPSVESDTNDKLCQFSRTWEELIYSQAGSTFDDASIVKQRLSVTRRKEEPGGTPNHQHLATLDLSYDAWVDKDVSTELVSKYEAIRTWLITQIDNTLNGNTFALTMEDPQFFYDENRISVSMTARGQITGEPIIEQRVTVDDDDTKGWEIIPKWTGDPLSVYAYQGPRIVIRSVVHSLTTIGWFDNVKALKFANVEINRSKYKPVDASGGRWLVIRQRPAATKLVMGIGNNTMRTTEITVTTSMRYIKEEGGGPAISPPAVVRVPAGGPSG